ncbi:hypothetical protein K461DRAFT_289903 [Myriangium duriaei CBS 260.36]|uniref:Uncharacterized protein n=1 Tax=Myriangium duriaei CBS 260.36 TaxID=1168546 RepID=A0A9P4MSJ6_9PEZI|nr:hypothetical protein K461DRAFT_289903 [Myriangium duriaei CBS 260.36]
MGMVMPHAHLFALATSAAAISTKVASTTPTVTVLRCAYQGSSSTASPTALVTLPSAVLRGAYQDSSSSSSSSSSTITPSVSRADYQSMSSAPTSTTMINTMAHPVRRDMFQARPGMPAGDYEFSAAEEALGDIRGRIAGELLLCVIFVLIMMFPVRWVVGRTVGRRRRVADGIV